MTSRRFLPVLLVLFVASGCAPRIYEIVWFHLLELVIAWSAITLAVWLGFFYGGNIAGAVIGSLLAGFYLLRVFDISTATFVAVALNVTVAALGLVLAKSTPHEPAAASAPQAEGAPGSADAWSVYVAIGLSGMTALAAEVIWTRLLSLVFGATVYTFSLILAVFLIGLGIGSSLGSVLSRGLT